MSKLSDINTACIGIDISREAVEVAEYRLKKPYKTESKLLKIGVESYKTKNPVESAILAQLDCDVVQRNKGIDGFLRKYYKNALVAVKIQKDSENGIKFRTRFDIVYKVCKRISSDIVVVPNGNLLIGDVFTGYTREQKNVQFCYEGGTMAMRVFGEFLAPMIGVKWRFFGTEPFDVTTNEYNNDAKRILPKLGIKPIIVQRI